MTNKRIIQTKQAAAPVGLYNQAIADGVKSTLTTSCPASANKRES